MKRIQHEEPPDSTVALEVAVVVASRRRSWVWRDVLAIQAALLSGDRFDEGKLIEECDERDDEFDSAGEGHHESTEGAVR